MELDALLGSIVENARRSGNPLGLRNVIGGWAKELDLPRRGRYVVYSGGLHDLAKYIKLSSRLLGVAESLRLGGAAVKAGRLGSSLIKAAARGRGLEAAAQRAVRALLRCGLDLAYAGDSYSGVLYYDLGLDRLFEEQAKATARMLASSGASVVVALDPHTAYALRELYPKFIEWSMDVKHYVELLYELEYTPIAKASGSLVLHDACYMARFLKLIEEPRWLLESLGYEVLEPECSRELTGCCGGPIEAMLPRISREVAAERAMELASDGAVAVECPICWSILSEQKLRVAELGELLEVGA